MMPPSGEDREGSVDTVHVDAFSSAEESQEDKENNKYVVRERCSRPVKRKLHYGRDTNGMAAHIHLLELLSERIGG
jgi:hypothetical protein